MVALVRACHTGAVNAEVRVVISPKGDSPGAEAARALDVPVRVCPPDGDILANLEGCDWICLAGYTRLLPPDVVVGFEHRILNIHPSLLPKFGGQGMYGRHVHEAVLASGDSESGCTVHWVTERYDEGAIILQRTCEIRPDDTVESLAARVLALEHEAYPAALAKVIVHAT